MGILPVKSRAGPVFAKAAPWQAARATQLACTECVALFALGRTWRTEEIWLRLCRFRFNMKESTHGYCGSAISSCISGSNDATGQINRPGKIAAGGREDGELGVFVSWWRLLSKGLFSFQPDSG